MQWFSRTLNRELATSATAALWGRSSPGITSKFTLCIDLNVIWQKKITPKVKGSDPCKCSAQAYEVLTGLHACTSHGVAGLWNLPSASQRAGSQPAALYLPVCLGGGARRHSSLASGEGARSCPGFCPSPVSASKAEFSVKSYFCTYRLQKNNKVN